MQVEALLGVRSYYEQPKAHELPSFLLQIRFITKNGKLDSLTKNTNHRFKRAMRSAIECIALYIFIGLLHLPEGERYSVHYLSLSAPSNTNLNEDFIP